MSARTPDVPGVEAPPGARRTLRRWALWPSWLLVAALTLLFASGLEVPIWVQYAPFALSLVFLGLPHGATDHLAVPRLLGREVWPGPALAVGFIYLALSGLYLALWFAAPVVAFALFLALTWFHWGAGDLHALLTFAPDEAAGLGDLRAIRASRSLALISRGGLPMLVPLLFFPEAYRAVAESVVGLFAPAAVDGLAWVFGAGFRLFAGAVLAALVLAALVLAYRVGDPAWRTDAAETALLVPYFALVPPVLAVGLYFCFWHAPRHVARLVLIDRTSAVALAAGRATPAFVRFARDAAPLTVAALALLLGLYLVAPGTGVASGTLLALYLVLISVLTLPHAAIVAWMDYRQGLWLNSRQRKALDRRPKA